MKLISQILFIFAAIGMLSFREIMISSVHAEPSKPNSTQRSSTRRTSGLSSSYQIIQFGIHAPPEALKKFNQRDYQGVIVLYTEFLKSSSQPIGQSGDDTALSLDPDTKGDYVIEAYLGRGMARYKLADKQGALEDYAQAVQLLQKMHEEVERQHGGFSTYLDDAYLLAGMTREELNDHAGAIKDYDQALRWLHGDHKVYALRAALRWKRQNQKGAEEDAKQLQEQSPWSALGPFEIPYTKDYVINAYLAKAQVRTLFADQQGALAELDTALKLGQEVGSIYMLRGAVEYAFGDYKAATAAHEQAIQLLPTDARAYYQLALDRAAVGDSGGVIDACTHAIQLNSLYAAASELRSTYRASIGDNKGAAEDEQLAQRSTNLSRVLPYDQQLQLNPRDGQAYAKRGGEYLSQKNYQRAIADCTQACAGRERAE